MVTSWLCFGVAMLLMRMEAGTAVTVAVALVSTRLLVRPFASSSGFAREIHASAQWIDGHLPDDAIVLVHNAGGVSQFAHRRVVELVGLKTPSSVMPMGWTWPSCGRERGRAVAAIARESGASYFVALSRWDEPLRKDLQAEGFQLTALRHPPTGTLAGYTIYPIDSPGGLDRATFSRPVR
jgi:hypothetical protein